MALEPSHSPPDYGSSKDPIIDSEKGSRNGNGGLEGGVGRRTSMVNGKPIGARIAPVLKHLRGPEYGSSDSEADILAVQIEAEEGNSIQYRTCSWPKVCYTPSVARTVK